jgi:Queuosine biosynthesis protein QueC
MYSQYDFRFQFEEVSLGFSQVLVTDYKNSETQRYQVFVDDRNMGIRLIPQFPARVSDLIDLAIAVFATDRILKPDMKQRLRIHVILPVTDPELMSDTKVTNKLWAALAQYTEHDWQFTFTKREGNNRPSVLQLSLPFGSPKSIEVVLWSGGLDALAGFLNRISLNPDKHFVLFGTGSNTTIHRLQATLRTAVERRYPSSTTLVRLPYSVRKTTSSLPAKPLLRSRGFTFILLGAVCAYLQGQRVLHLYENGIGAINLPFRLSETGLDHSRAVHPLSLRYMSELLTLILGVPFEVVNPFLFSTKAQMCEIFHYSNYVELVAQTVTCDHVHRNLSNQPAMQCGRCSSCTLRRQALAAAGIYDETSYVYEEFFSNNVEPVYEHDHLPAVLHQVETLRRYINTSDPWRSLRQQYPTLSLDIVDRAAQNIKLEQSEIIGRLVQLYRRYVFEWDMLGEGFYEQ